MMSITMNMHTITSPNNTMNVAPPTLAANTTSATSRNTINAKIINNIIVFTLLSIICNVFSAKSKEASFEASSFGLNPFDLVLRVLPSVKHPSNHAADKCQCTHDPSDRALNHINNKLHINTPFNFWFCFHKGVCNFRESNNTSIETGFPSFFR